jgi:hypothetical protein
MKKLLGVPAVLLLALPLSFAQGSANSSDASNAQAPVSRTADNGPRDNNSNWGWIGIFGLAGLAGLMGRRDRNTTMSDRDRNVTDFRRAA